MVDSFTPNLNLLQPLVGGDSGTWGTLLNNGVMGVLDNILGSSYSTSITAADVTLTTTQFQNGAFVLSGTLTGNHSFILPYQTGTTTVAVGGKFIVINNTAGAFKVTVTTQAANATSTVAVAPQGQVTNLYSDGVNVNYTDTGNPATVPATSGSPQTQLAGTAGTTNVNASLAADYANGQLYLCTQSGTAASAKWTNVSNPQGFDGARNFNFTTTVSGNVLTVTALAADTATTPSAGHPIIIPVQNFQGLWTLFSFTSALTLSTNVGASFGATSNTPFRLWLVSADAHGLGLINCSSGTTIFSLNESQAYSTVAMSSGATSPGVIYTSGSQSSTGIRILGLIEYSSGLVTPGTFNNAPSNNFLFGPGIRKPGDSIQVVSPASGTSVAVTPSSAINLFYVVGGGTAVGLTGSTPFQCASGLVGRRNATVIQTAAIFVNGSGAGQTVEIPATVAFIDNPATTALVTYSIQGTGANFSSIAFPKITVSELMS